MGGCIREKIISNIGLVVKSVSDAMFVLDWREGGYQDGFVM